MNTWIAWLRGVNVGGHRKLPMKDLRETMVSAGFENVATYIQSGNVVFRSRMKSRNRVEDSLASLIEEGFGFRPSVDVRTLDQLRDVVERSPVPKEPEDSKSLHVFFLRSEPTDPDDEKIQNTLRPSEGYYLQGDVAYLHTPDGFGTSKIAERLERYLRVEATARNWRTIHKVLALAES